MQLANGYQDVMSTLIRLW